MAWCLLVGSGPWVAVGSTPLVSRLGSRDCEQEVSWELSGITPALRGAGDGLGGGGSVYLGWPFGDGQP